jgi:hypothetical protein
MSGDAGEDHPPDSQDPKEPEECEVEGVCQLVVRVVRLKKPVSSENGVQEEYSCRHPTKQVHQLIRQVRKFF